MYSILVYNGIKIKEERGKEIMEEIDLRDLLKIFWKRKAITRNNR